MASPRTSPTVAVASISTSPTSCGRSAAPPHVRIELPGNKNFALSAEVMRVDRITGELGMQFEPTEIDLAPIDRLVYATVKRQKLTEE